VSPRQSPLARHRARRGVHTNAGGCCNGRKPRGYWPDARRSRAAEHTNARLQSPLVRALMCCAHTSNEGRALRPALTGCLACWLEGAIHRMTGAL
jgi:hypothetical protein